MSGISPSEDAKTKYGQVKTGKNAFGVFEIKDEKTVECTHLEDKIDSTPESFEENVWAKLTSYAEENLAKSPAYIIAPFKYTTEDGREAEKLVLISWCPEGKCKVKAKMLHGSTLGSIKQTFEGLQMKPYQANDNGDVSFDEVLKEVKA